MKSKYIVEEINSGVFIIRDKDDNFICDFVTKKDAYYFLEAVNNYEALQKRCEELEKIIPDLLEANGQWLLHIKQFAGYKKYDKEIEFTKNAIAKAHQLLGE